jgi:hypothetical protein
LGVSSRKDARAPTERAYADQQKEFQQIYKNNGHIKVHFSSISIRHAARYDKKRLQHVIL